MNPNEKIAQLEETIRLKDQEIYDVKTSVAGVLEEIHELNEKNEDEVLRRQIAELCTNTRYELLIDETKNRTTIADQSNK
jgi:regulator of replication initiation timing